MQIVAKKHTQKGVSMTDSPFLFIYRYFAQILPVFNFFSLQGAIFGEWSVLKKHTISRVVNTDFCMINFQVKKTVEALRMLNSVNSSFTELPLVLRRHPTASSPYRPWRL